MVPTGRGCCRPGTRIEAVNCGRQRILALKSPKRPESAGGVRLVARYPRPLSMDNGVSEQAPDVAGVCPDAGGAPADEDVA